MIHPFKEWKAFCYSSNSICDDSIVDLEGIESFEREFNEIAKFIHISSFCDLTSWLYSFILIVTFLKILYLDIIMMGIRCVAWKLENVTMN